MLNFFYLVFVASGLCCPVLDWLKSLQLPVSTMLLVLLLLTTLWFCSIFPLFIVVFEEKAWLHGYWVGKINRLGVEVVEYCIQQRFCYSVFLVEALWSCCVKRFPVWDSCDSSQGIGIGTDWASKPQNFPSSLTCALYALLTRDRVVWIQTCVC